jgi:8-oxo-dGTP pyrophosphatase MutT (NUDIX family)
MIKPAYIAWGLVTRNTENGEEILIAERNKKSDPLRDGQLIIPGGGINQGESYIEAAIREVREETGIETGLPHIISGRELRKIDNRIKALVMGDGRIKIEYLDSGNIYIGKIVSLKPVDPYQEPKEQKDSDAKSPRYVSLKEIPKLAEKFTPAGQVLLKIAEAF